MLESLIISYLLTGICLAVGYVLVAILILIMDDPSWWLISQELKFDTFSPLICISVALAWPVILLVLYNQFKNDYN